MMTKIASFLFIGFLIQAALSCKAQIIPVEDHINYMDNEIEIPDGAYVKDVNNLLVKFIGTWKGNFNNKNHEFRIIKHTTNFLGILKDELLMRYKITDSNGATIEDTTKLTDDNIYVIKGDYLDKNKSTYVLSYIGKEYNCGQNGNVFIEVSTNDLDNMKFFLVPDGEIIDCPYSEVSQVLPIALIILCKQ